MKMNRLLLLWLIIPLMLSGCAGEKKILSYTFADQNRAAEMLLANRNYYDHLNQKDLDFRMQKKGATLAEYEEFARGEVREFTAEEKKAIEEAMKRIEDIVKERGYHLPIPEEITFARTTMKEECDASAYTLGTEIYLGGRLSGKPLSYTEDNYKTLMFYLSHELFHCLTRNDPEFRKTMYDVIGFTVTGTDVDFSPEIREQIISNPDVEHRDAYAEFTIGKEKKKCVAVLITKKDFEQPGDNFFDEMVTGLVPIDAPDQLYTSDDASDFWDVFGRNTDYAIDPEETLADNFAFAIVNGTDGIPYKNPEIIAEIDRRLKAMK